MLKLIAGIATGGIPHAAWVAQKLNLPMLYVRDKAKGHGKTEPDRRPLQAGQKVVADRGFDLHRRQLVEGCGRGSRSRL